MMRLFTFSFLLVFLLLSSVCFSQSDFSQAVSVEVFAGNYIAGNINGPRLSSRLDGPVDMAYDEDGNLFIAEESGACIRKIDKDGNVTNFVGDAGTSGFADGSGSNARFFDIRGIAFDNLGSLIVADKGNHRIRKVTPEGVVTTIAGGISGFKDGDVSEALFNKPSDVLIDNYGNILVTDASNNRVRKIDVNGNVSTLIGRSQSGYTDGNISVATLDNPTDLAIDNQGNLIIVTSYGVRKLDRNTNLLSTLVGGAGADSYLDGDENSAGFGALQGLIFESSDLIYLIDRHSLRRLNSDFSVNTITGSGGQGNSVGSLSSSRFFYPRGAIKTPEGDILIADRANNVIKKVKMTYDGPQVASILRSNSAIKTDDYTVTSFDVTFDKVVRNVDVSDFIVKEGLVSGEISEVEDYGNGDSYRVEVSSIDGSGILNLDFSLDNDIVDDSNFSLFGEFNTSLEAVYNITSSSTNRPLLVSTTPADNSDEYNGTLLTMVFNKDVFLDRGRIRLLDFESGQEIAGAGMKNQRVSVNGNVVQIDLRHSLPLNKEIYVKIPGVAIHDGEGNYFEAVLDKETFNFKTATRPELLATNPVHNSTGFNGDNLQITFDRPIFAGVGRIKVMTKLSDVEVEGAGVNSDRVSIDGNVVTLSFIKKLPENTDLYVLIPGSAFKDDNDLFFRGLISENDWIFKTDGVDFGSKSFSDQEIVSFETTKMVAYPNPASSYVTIDFADSLPNLFQIVDTSGRSVYVNENIVSKKLNIEVSDFRNGVYIMKSISKSGQVISKKLLITRTQ